MYDVYVKCQAQIPERGAWALVRIPDIGGERLIVKMRRASVWRGPGAPSSELSWDTQVLDGEVATYPVAYISCHVIGSFPGRISTISINGVGTTPAVTVTDDRLVNNPFSAL
jgi:hypothetical protein